MGATSGGTTTGRERLRNATLGLCFLALSVLAAEAVMRSAVPWLVAAEAGYSRNSGLPLRWLEKNLKALRRSSPQLVFVGDSFVLSGLQSRGWITSLRRLTGRPLGGLGVNGACPSQYWLMSDAVRQAGIEVPIVVMLFIGNDFADESVWASLDSDRSQYEAARIAYYSDPALPTYWPCFQIRPELNRPLARMAYALRRHSALYRASVLALGNAFSEEGVSRFMSAECGRAPWAEQVGDRLFFFRLHDAGVNPQAQPIADAQASILNALVGEAHRDLVIAPVLDREENCAAFHGREVRRAAPFIEALRARGLKVLDTNPDLARECAQRQLFLPDGHWTREGQEVFARSLRRLLTEGGLLRDAPPPDRR